MEGQHEGQKRPADGVRMLLATVIICVTVVGAAMLSTDLRFLLSGREWVTPALASVKVFTVRPASLDAAGPEQAGEQPSATALHSEREIIHRRVIDMFPQAAACMKHPWIHRYSELHSRILTGEGGTPPRYLVAIPNWSGTADRLTSIVTQFYLAVLSGRAFTMYVPPDRLPSFSAVCDYPFFNWTHPERLPDSLMTPFTRDLSRKPIKAANETANYPPPYTRQYVWHNMVNPLNWQLDRLLMGNLSGFPADHPGVPYVISSSNRGATWNFLQNPYHREQFWRMSLSPENAFMCGFFYLCSPNAAVQQLYYEPYWKPLQDPRVLKIGIQVRFGDEIAFLHTNPLSVEGLLKLAAPFFMCAAEIERAFAAPGQQVIWYLLSDSGAFRKAAKQIFGRKLLTDTEFQPMHIDCQMNGDPSLCSDAPLNDALRQSVGSIMAFSLTDYHVITQRSGFGRMGAWLSGRWNNIYELAPGDEDAASACPLQPTTPEESASRWSHI